MVTEIRIPTTAEKTSFKKIDENSKCWEDKKVKFQSDVVTYDMCEKQYKCIE